MNKNLIVAIVVVVLVAVGGYIAYMNNLIPGFGPSLSTEVMPSDEMMEGDTTITNDVQGEYTEEYVEVQE